MNAACMFTIIVPVYNVKKYLCQCIESVLRQRYTDYELLLIDDGSTDGSGITCDEYAAKDARVKVIHKENGGAASARNEGLTNAKGTWIVFLDGDDYYASDRFLLDICKVIRKEPAEVICYGVVEVYERGGPPAIRRDTGKLDFGNTTDEDEKLAKMISGEILSGAAWQYAIKHSFVAAHKLLFDESFKETNEDTEWVFRVFLESPKLAKMEQSMYFYRVRSNSACTKARETGFWKNRYQMIGKTLDQIRTQNCTERRKELLYQRLAYEYYVLLGQVNDEPDRMVRRELIRNVRKYKGLCSWGGVKKTAYAVC